MHGEPFCQHRDIILLILMDDLKCAVHFGLLTVDWGSHLTSCRILVFSYPVLSFTNIGVKGIPISQDGFQVLPMLMVFSSSHDLVYVRGSVCGRV